MRNYLSLKTGISDKLRGKIWLLLCRSLDVAINHSEDLYYKLVQTDMIEVEDLIKKDIDRTIMYTIYTNKENKSQIKKIDISNKHKKLSNILKAYAIYDGEVGYCQGTNYIVAVLLSNINSERACFWTFVQLMNDKKWRDLYKNNTPKLMRMLEVLNNSLKLKVPILYEYFESTKVSKI